MAAFASTCARLAAEAAVQAFRAARPGTSLNGALWQIINSANLAVYDASNGEGRMQTTRTAVVFRNEQIGLGHLGDCRVYRIRHGTAKALTADHTFVAFHERIGLLNAPTNGNSPLRGGLTRCRHHLRLLQLLRRCRSGRRRRKGTLHHHLRQSGPRHFGHY